MTAPRPPANAARTAMAAAGGALVMLTVAFAAKPLYDTFCRVTGFGGTTQRADVGADRVADHAVTVRFDATVNGDLPIAFEPVSAPQTHNAGENGLAFFRFENLSDQPVRAVATYNVTPHKAGPYFTKLECFCFDEQEYAPGAVIELPVVYYVDPAIAEGERVTDVRTITLAYTFYAGKGEDISARGGTAAPAK